MGWLLYGANGYTGTLVAHHAVARGQQPVLAGRDGPVIAALAAELGLEHRIVPLTDGDGLRRILSAPDIDAVAHCAGPFTATARPMVAACLDTGTHYLDVTGEVEVFEWVYGVHAKAVEAGVVLLPGAGFDVVPTDCLAARLAARLPAAVRLDLAFRVGGGASRGTARTALAGAGAGMLRRVDGVLVPGVATRPVPFPSGVRRATALRWGDLAAAYRSTGIGTITVYADLPGAGRLGRLLRYAPLRAVARQVVARRPPGPDAATRARTGCEVWGEVADAAGRVASAALTGPNPYDLTADALVRAVERLLAGGVPPGAHTPATALGADFAWTLDNVHAA